MARAAERSRRLLPVYALVFVVGMASLGAEIAAARLLAPFFGASTIVWANTIGVVLVSLSVGYWLGGRLADRYPRRSGLCAVAATAALMLAIVPFVAHPFLAISVKAFDEISVGAFLGSLAAVLALVAVPVMLLGAAAPYAIRIAVGSIEESGTVAGRMYAISTVGSLVGTFASALLLIPLVGTRRTFLFFALVLALVAVLGLRRRFAFVPILIAGAIALPVGGIKSTADGRVLFETETPYQYARVVARGDTRTLELNEGYAVHSKLVGLSYLTGDYWDEFLVLPFATLAGPPARVAVLGDGAGTQARALGHFYPRTWVDGVEIDGELTRIGRRYFDLRNPRLKTYTEDARPYLERRQVAYDVIEIDAYHQPYIPFYLTTREFFELTRKRLAPGGMVMINVGHPAGNDDLERALTATLRRVYPFVSRDPVTGTNTMLVASGAPIEPARLKASIPRLPVELRPTARAAAARLAPALPGGPVYSDDRAPVEWLIDRSIVEYAARQGGS